MKHSISIFLLAIATTASAQIKVFSGGLHSYGSTSALVSGENIILQAIW